MLQSSYRLRIQISFSLAAILCALLVASVTPRPVDAAQPDPIASYDIQVALDVEGKTLRGRETIAYVNRTEAPIPDLVFHLYLNAFRDTNSLFLKEGGPMHRGYAWDPEHPGWIEVTGLWLTDGTPLTLEDMEDGTLARAELPQPIAPGAEIVIDVEFTAQLPRVFARTGFADDYFLVGQWFPKLGVWETEGWNAHPFYANAEFYANFGAYDVAITLPQGYVAGATGMPLSAVDHTDGTQTIRYHAGNVIDFAWTASPRFRTAIQEVDGIEIMYLYLPEHAWTVQRVLAAAEAAVTRYNRWYGRYPYARLTLVDAPDDGQGAGGMEYPTLVTIGAMDITGTGASRFLSGADRSLETVTVHEIAHQWWQSMVAFNEAEEPWLDEGLADYSTLRVLEDLYGETSSMYSGRDVRLGYIDYHRLSYLSNPRVPMFGRAWDFGLEYVIATYSKPLLAWRTLERTLGDDVVLQILSTFFDRYQFRHPTTEDLRAAVTDVCGQDLAWFFEGLVYGEEIINYGVTALDDHRVEFARQGDLIIPTEVRITFADGTSVIEPWDGVDARRTLAYPDSPPIVCAEIDPDRRIALDLRWSDNGACRSLDLWSLTALIARVTLSLQNTLLMWGGL